MDLTIRAYQEADLPAMIAIWNEIVEEGIAFPQEDCLDGESGRAFFAAQSYTGVAVDRETEKLLGLYILHPNNVGRCGHICNASYAVASQSRGLHIGEKLILDCMERGREQGYRVLQFNAVVASNTFAIRLYESLGFQRLGVLPGGFRDQSGTYQDTILFYHTL